MDVRLEKNYSYHICEIYSGNFAVCLNDQFDQFFLPFNVNCSQVAMFQIMPALCLHGQAEGGGQPNVNRPGQGQICADIFYG